MTSINMNPRDQIITVIPVVYACRRVNAGNAVVVGDSMPWCGAASRLTYCAAGVLIEGSQ